MSTAEPGLQRFREAGSSECAVQVEAARIAARRGNRKEARLLLRLAVEADPGCTEAWLGLAWLASSAAERRDLLGRVLALDPGNVRAMAEMDRLRPETSRAGTLAGPVQSALAPAVSAAPRSPDPSMSASRGEGPRQSRRAGQKRGRGRALGWFLALASGVLLMVAGLLLWSPLGSSLAALLPAPSEMPVPTPTAGPSEVAGRFVPQLESALLGAKWDRAMELVIIMQSLAPSDPVVAGWARKAHVQLGQALVWDGRAGDALAHFDEALAAVPDDAEAILWQSTTQAYLAGRQALLSAEWESAVNSFLVVRAQIPDYADAMPRLLEAYRGLGRASIAASDWTRAIDALTKAQELDPAASGITDMLELAYRERGIARKQAGDLVEARADLEAALVLAPGDAVAKTHLEQVMYKLFPPKRIDIDISEQRMYVYLGDKLLYKWVISTGLPGRDTAAGHYKVLDKIPMAYSKVWNLKMPYWLGIYYVGGIENGIHALPIRPDGTVMWAGFLGQKASYGCVILDNTAAPILFNWAEIGTKVDIHY